MKTRQRKTDLRCAVDSRRSDPQGIDNLRHVAGRGIMASQRPQSRRTDKYPPGGPAEWLADGHVTCNIQCSAGKCDRRMVDVRLDTLPQDLPWAKIGLRLVCKECGTAGSVNIVPNWMTELALPCRSRGTGKHETQL
jgi:hypothetical protein